MNMRSFFGRHCRSLFPHRAAVTLWALLTLAWSGPAFCGEIHDAVRDGDLAKVQALLKGNPDLVSSIDQWGETPLHWAADRGHKDVAELLLASKAEVNAKDSYSETPLHWAADFGHKDVAELLLANKAEVNAQDKLGFTPLHYAVLRGHNDVAELLRKHGGHE